MLSKVWVARWKQSVLEFAKVQLSRNRSAILACLLFVNIHSDAEGATGALWCNEEGVRKTDVDDGKSCKVI